jgi:iron complex outermembrane receptor protein
MSSSSQKIALALAIAAGLPCAVHVGVAGADTAIPEIVVNARKREESSLNVPVALTALTAQDIASAGIERPQDYVALTPNMTLVQTQNQGTSFVVVRGISQARNSEPSVAVLIDGVLQANPSQFNQELIDIENIQILKGPQGALYGRNAIGGAIIINSKAPTDKFEGNVMAGVDSGFGYKLRGSVSGPITDTLKYRATVSYFDTDGYIQNTFLNKEADPFKDLSGRLRLLWEPSDKLKADFRFYGSKVDTQALYFNITGDVNDVSLPVRVNNHGVNERNMYGVSLKLDYDVGFANLTTVTAYDSLDELLTGDQFNFLPIPQSVLFQVFGSDQAQHQFLDVSAVSQEIRLTSPANQRLRWIAGAYGIWTDRFISTGNVFDLGTGTVPEVKRTPLTLFAPQFTYLADSQNNFAWALFGEIAFDITDRLEGSVSLRYDRDNRENTTETPQQFIPAALQGIAFPGQVRKRSWDQVQPKATLRYKPTDNTMVYGGYSRGFRSGGFNQTGVVTAGIAGVQDLFDAETADTYEIGTKTEWFDRRLKANASVYYTEAKGTYFFVFDPNTSTQNLGNLGKVNFVGGELELNGRVAEGLDAYFNFGYTDSDIRKSGRDANDVGNQAPLVSRYTANVGAQYQHAIPMFGGITGFIRTDYEIIGPTWFYPDNFTRRKAVNLLNLRLGVEADRWSVTAWSKNLTNEKYNSEWSPGPRSFPNPGYSNNFVFKALPLRWGVDVAYHF